MADLRLRDVVLLQSLFLMWPDGPPQPTPDDESAPFEYPDGDFMLLAPTTSREDDEFTLYLEAKIEAGTMPFQLELLIGARFSVNEEPDLKAEDAEPTLVWLIYPYLRELIGSITSRSPLPPYYLPALSKLPHPSVAESQPSAPGE
jgi:hypothetical protein